MSLPNDGFDFPKSTLSPAVRSRVRGKIMLAEDTDMLREMLAMHLRLEGYAVVETSDGERALARLSENDDTYLALISDLDMPRKDGCQLIREIESMPPRFSAYILVSGSHDFDSRIQALQLAKTKTPLFFYPKPFNMDVILELLEKLAER